MYMYMFFSKYRLKDIFVHNRSRKHIFEISITYLFGRNIVKNG